MIIKELGGEEQLKPLEEIIQNINQEHPLSEEDLMRLAGNYGISLEFKNNEATLSSSNSKYSWIKKENGLYYLKKD